MKQRVSCGSMSWFLDVTNWLAVRIMSCRCRRGLDAVEVESRMMWTGAV